MPLGGGLMAGASALSGIISGIAGIGQRRRGNKLLAQTPFPTEQMPPEVLANQQIAQSAATQGMPSEQYEAALKNIRQTQAQALSSATDRRSGVQNAGAFIQGSNMATGNLDAQSAEMRRQNTSQLLGVNQQVASWRDKLFDWNQRQKYLQNYNYAMGLVGQGNQNIMSGVDKFLGGGLQAASTMFNPSSAQPSGASGSYQPQLANVGATGPQSPAGVFAPGGTMSTVAPNLMGGFSTSGMSNALMANPYLFGAAA